MDVKFHYYKSEIMILCNKNLNEYYSKYGLKEICGSEMFYDKEAISFSVEIKDNNLSEENLKEMYESSDKQIYDDILFETYLVIQKNRGNGDWNI